MIVQKKLFGEFSWLGGLEQGSWWRLDRSPNHKVLLIQIEATRYEAAFSLKLVTLHYELCGRTISNV